MAVFTPVSTEQCQAFLKEYPLGALVSLDGIVQGVENSNFRLTTSQGRYILTLFEGRTAGEDLSFFVSLMQGLAQAGVPCPLPVTKRNGEALGVLNGRKALIVSFLEGKDLAAPDGLPAHAAALGAMMARLHHAGADLPLERANRLGPLGWKALVERIGGEASRIDPALPALLRDSHDRIVAAWPKALTPGLIHADLFPDNVFFDPAGRLTGLIDFYFACRDFRLYDLAIAINAWCFDATHRFRPDMAAALTAAYRRDAGLPEEEWRHLPVLCQGAALRFLLTRAHDWLFGAGDALITPKDPMEYVAKLQFHAAVTDFRVYGAA